VNHAGTKKSPDPRRVVVLSNRVIDFGERRIVAGINAGSDFISSSSSPELVRGPGAYQATKRLEAA
jgi:hypothetical protein